MSDKYQELFNGILEGDAAAVEAGAAKALAAGNDPAEILGKGMIAPMREVGRLFEEGEYYVPEMLVAARAMKAGLQLLKPHLIDTGVEPVGKVVIGTVKGDLHDIGKNLVSMMLEGAGFALFDLGTDVAPEKFVSALQEDGPDVIALSALLTTTMPSMKSTIEAIAAAGLRDKVKVIIGGAPVTQVYADKIGADGFAPDANGAVSLVENLLGIRHSTITS